MSTQCFHDMHQLHRHAQCNGNKSHTNVKQTTKVAQRKSRRRSRNTCRSRRRARDTGRMRLHLTVRVLYVCHYDIEPHKTMTMAILSMVTDDCIDQSRPKRERHEHPGADQEAPRGGQEGRRLVEAQVGPTIIQFLGYGLKNKKHDVRLHLRRGQARGHVISYLLLAPNQTMKATTSLPFIHHNDQLLTSPLW
jgi:hypothetical protein